MKKNNKKRNTSIGCLFWIALILLVLIVFLFNRERIRTVIEETGFDELVTRQEEPEREPEVKRTPPDEEESETTEDQKEPEEPGLEMTEETQEEPAEEPEDEIRVEEETEEEERSAPEEEPRIDQKMRKSDLYFVSVADDGTISLERIVRPVYYDSSPLTNTLEALLKGLTSSELNEGLLNLIPEETQLRRVWVEDGIAYIDFSEELKFNPFGTEGLRASLRQIVYTATEFNTVSRVQILIEGSTPSYLSSEGVYIGEPIGREDL
jgi:spore germination protein GerM